MGTRYITVRLTEAEAHNAANAIGYATDYPQCLDPFGETAGQNIRNVQGLNAANRAARKIAQALG